MGGWRLALVKTAFATLVGLTGVTLCGCDVTTAPAAPTIAIPTPAELPSPVSAEPAAIQVPAVARTTGPMEP
jgi:hypothetical protein